MRGRRQGPLESGFVRLEIRDETGKTVDVPVDSFRVAGCHMAYWNTKSAESGDYRWFMNVNGLKREGTVRLVRN